ncbi:MAG: hypothetical protein JNL03_16215 [Prolixibacteraceae bacterium]|nr:hypothetical protein [Prolixibacteraceae bacterium]
MKEEDRITDEQVEKLQKKIAYLKERNTKLVKRYNNTYRANVELNTQLRAEQRVHERLRDELYVRTHGVGFYSMAMFLNWVDEVVLENEKLKDEKLIYPFKIVKSKRVKLTFCEN